MGKFDGILICSDIDGTLNCKGDTLEVNREAVLYFTANGGRFAFATGRMAAHIHQEQFAEMANGPVCLCNGSIIYDPIDRRILKETPLPFTLGEFVEAMAPYLTRAGKAHLCHASFAEGTKAIPFEELNDKNLPDWNLQLHKLVFSFPEPALNDAFTEILINHPFLKNTYISQSWGKGVEINAPEGTKGAALKYIKEYLGDVHTSIGIGDYGNDITLLQAADIGVAVGNAVPELKEIADLIVKPGNEYAVKDLIEILDKKELIPQSV